MDEDRTRRTSASLLQLGEWHRRSRGLRCAAMADLYDILQVSPRADADVVRAAFRALARKHHPDFGGDSRAMIALSEAWHVLGDARKRAAYDRLRSSRPIASRHATTRPSPSPAARPAPPSEPDAAADLGATAGPGEPSFEGPSGRILDFGRYQGWSLQELAHRDPDYLEWLKRTPIGRPFRADIDALLQPAAAGAAPAAPRSQKGRRSFFGRF